MKNINGDGLSKKEFVMYTISTSLIEIKNGICCLLYWIVEFLVDNCRYLSIEAGIDYVL